MKLWLKMKKLLRRLTAGKPHKFEHRYLTHRFFGRVYFYSYAKVHAHTRRLLFSKQLLIDFVPYKELGKYGRKIRFCFTRKQREKAYSNIPENATAVRFHQAIRFGLQYAFAVYQIEKEEYKGIKVKVVDVVKNLATNDEHMAYVSAQMLWKALNFTPSQTLILNDENEQVNFLPKYLSFGPPWRKPASHYATSDTLQPKLSLDEAISKIQKTYLRMRGTSDQIYTYHQDIGFGWLFTSGRFYDNDMFLKSLMGTFRTKDYSDYEPLLYSNTNYFILDKFNEEIIDIPPRVQLKTFLDKYKNKQGYH